MPRLFLFIPCLAMLAGCGGADYGEAEPTFNDIAHDIASSNQTSSLSGGVTMDSVVGGDALASLQRKIVYTADVEVVVEDYAQAAKQVEELIQRFNGRIASSNESGTSGQPRSGVWVVRIPVSDFEDFLTATNDLGEVRNKSRESQDRTIKFYDLQQDIKNKLSEEIGLRKLQEEDRGSLPDVLAVAREVSRVRGEINILEGHMRQLKDLISLTTVTLRVHELNVYVPEHAPEFGTRVERSWKGSLKSLRDFGASCVVWLVAAGPWLVVIGLPVLVSYKVARHRSRRRKKRRAPSPSAPPVDDEG